MIDLHSHILPGFDDGARDMAESLAMVKIAAESGTSAIVATPHISRKFCPDWALIIKWCDKLQAAARGQGLAIDVIPGAEVSLTADVLCSIDGPGAYCIAQGRYMLIEFPFAPVALCAEFVLSGLRQKGITPILAHPERHPHLAIDHSLLRSWVTQGGLVQINATSLSGRFSSLSMAVASKWLTEGLVHCVGSDAHSVFSRSTKLTREQAIIRELVGSARAQEILVTNPQKIIQGQAIPIRMTNMESRSACGILEIGY